ncbi:MAG: hypothetical protein O6649_02605, partial [Gammaproteobacteria bacterium]|nr:hypothetical protein [Gammaproteobacteria bacterium]
MQSQPELIRWSELTEQLAKVLPDPDRSPGIPPACYADTEILKQETNAIFHRGWVCLGRSDRWVNTGDYSAMDIGGIHCRKIPGILAAVPRGSRGAL